MSTHVTELFEKASNLSDKDRATLAGLLIESLESEIDPDVERRMARRNRAPFG